MSTTINFARNRMNGITFLILCVSLTSCASSPTVQSQIPAGTACIKGGMANVIRHFTSGEPHVAVNPQRNSGGPYSEHCIPAGKNTILVAAARGPGLGVNALVTIALLEGHRYVVRSVYADDVYHFTVVDITDKAERTAYEFTIPKGRYGKNVFTSEAAPPIDLTKPAQ